MDLDSNFQYLIEQAKNKLAPAVIETPISVMREMYRDKYLSRGIGKVPGVAVRDENIDSAGLPLALRFYWPEEKMCTGLPLIIYFHGGGYVLGDVAAYDNQCRAMALKTDAMVMCVNYRLAPEHKYPAAVEDAINSVVWAFEHRHKMQFGKIVLAGDSAGGALATIAAMQVAAQGKKLDYLALFYPWIDQTPLLGECTYESIDQFGEGYFLDKTILDWFSLQYCINREDVSKLDISPLYNANMVGLTASLVITAGCDPLRDMGKKLAAQLSDLEVNVKYINYPGLIHNFLGFAGIVPASQRAFDEICELLAKQLHS